jgi:peptidoglycan/LPS O-acetylase OafA/YrhL
LVLEKKRIAFLDPLRGMAILMVFAFHCVDLYSPVSDVRWQHVWRQWPDAPAWLLPLYAGWIGVPLFFVISGLCIQLSYNRSVSKGQASWWVFFIQRFFRVYPPYIVVFLVLWGMAVCRQHPVDTTSVLSHVGLLQNLWPEWMYDLNAALWSVAVEWQLYLIYPLTWLASRLWGWRVCLTLAAALEMALNVWPSMSQLGLFHPMPTFLNHSPFAYWFSWSLGAALADSYLQQKPMLMEWWHRLLWLGLLVIGLCFKPLYPLTFLYAALFFASVISRLLFSPAKITLPPIPILSVCTGHLAWVGTISYSIYLIHLPVINMYPWVTRHVPGLLFLGPWSQFVISVLLWPVILLLSWGAYNLLEKPSIELGRWVQLLWNQGETATTNALSPVNTRPE